MTNIAVLHADLHFIIETNETQSKGHQGLHMAIPTDWISFLPNPMISPGIHSAFISVPPILHGVRGRPLLLPVKYNFTTANVEIQGDWKLYDTMLVAFRNHNVISNPSMEHRHTFLPPDASLLINVLEEKAEGQYKVDIRLKFPDKPDIIEESRVVRVTVNGEQMREIHEKSTGGLVDFNATLFVSSCFDSNRLTG